MCSDTNLLNYSAPEVIPFYSDSSITDVLLNGFEQLFLTDTSTSFTRFSGSCRFHTYNELTSMTQNVSLHPRRLSLAYNAPLGSVQLYASTVLSPQTMRSTCRSAMRVPQVRFASGPRLLEKDVGISTREKSTPCVADCRPPEVWRDLKMTRRRAETNYKTMESRQTHDLARFRQ